MIHVSPSFQEFKKLARKGNLIPLSLDVTADEITPVSLLASEWDKKSHCFLLESVEGGERLGRYSIVSFEPELLLEENQGKTLIYNAQGKIQKKLDVPVLKAVKDLMSEVKPVSVPDVPRFYGGAVGYCSYEVVHHFEKLPLTKPDHLKWPVAKFFITGDLFIFDNTKQVLKIMACARIGKKDSLTRVYKNAQKRLLKNLKVIQNIRKEKGPKKNSSAITPFSTNMEKPAFMKIVKEAKEFIGKGDIIQVVLSRRSEKKTNASPLDIYRTLRRVNPSPYLYIFKMGTKAIIGSSPELLVRVEEGVAATRPIAGTRRRGTSTEQDEKLKEELLKDPKERAEHLMLVDLGRNDLGRVCDYSSICVPTFMTVEKYSHVMHIVSEVTGKLKPGKTAFDLFEAAFPAGTVSGAPKIRAMEIIDELEVSRRGPYAGAIGYFSYSGNMDMAITIRTILWDQGRVSIQTGAGIVADSDPAAEFQESENKAAALKETIRQAEAGLLLLR